MKTQLRRWRGGALLVLSLVVAPAMWAANAAAEPIDWERARELRQKMLNGATLPADERAYLERAVAERRKMQSRPESPAKSDGRAAARSPAPEPRDRTGLVPLSELGSDARYQGEDGGLYGGGRNAPPPEHLDAALAEARAIQPLAADGGPARDGKVVLLAVGMSNTTQEFSRFQEMAARDAAKAPHVVPVDGAQGGRTAAEWARPGDTIVWQTVAARLKAAGVTAAQVQVVWIKQANARPTEPFPEHARNLEADLAKVVQRLKVEFPNLRLAYLSSRTYGGYATTPLNPEPYAYESAFAVRWLIQRQLRGDAALNADPKRGAVTGPVLLWGPYLWADGLAGRHSDGLTWERGDFRDDGTHPSATSGRDKVAKQLLAFLQSDPTAKIWWSGESK